MSSAFFLFVTLARVLYLLVDECIGRGEMVCHRALFTLGVDWLVIRPLALFYSFSFSLSKRQIAYHRESAPHSTRSTLGGFQVPLRIEGVLSFGQYMRNIGIKAPVGAGSQLASLSLPGDSFWK
jgi:hypothetical protein